MGELLLYPEDNMVRTVIFAGPEKKPDLDYGQLEHDRDRPDLTKELSFLEIIILLNFLHVTCAKKFPACHFLS